MAKHFEPRPFLRVITPIFCCDKQDAIGPSSCLSMLKFANRSVFVH